MGRRLPKYAKVPLGPGRLKRTGAGTHADKRLKRARTREAQTRRAVDDQD